MGKKGAKMKKIKKEIENKLLKLGGKIIDSGLLNDNSGSDILFTLNKKQYYIEISEINNINQLIDNEFIN